MAIKKATTTDDVREAPEPANGYVKVTSPSGAVTEVPEGIAGALLDSGYSKSK